MADGSYTSPRACVECGNHIEVEPASFGRPRQRCLTCSPRRPSPPPKGRNTGPKPRPFERICQGCGEHFMAAQARTKACSPSCRWRVANPTAITRAAWNDLRQRASATHQDHTCQGCGATFRPKRTDRTKFCGRECAFANPFLWVSKEVRSAAAGKSGTKRRKRWPFSPVHCRACRQCGEAFISRRATSYCPTHDTAEKRRKSDIEARAPVVGTCQECDQPFIRPDKGALRRWFCSVTCSERDGRRIHHTKRRAREAAAHVEPVNPYKVFTRDGWRCQICRCTTPRSLRGTYHPRAPELDHIVALAKGGEHSYLNTQCACRRCNGLKGDKDIGQLRLFG